MYMDLTIVSENENKLLERKEVRATVTFDTVTPTRKDIRTEMGGKLAASPDTIVLRNVKSEFGMKKINVLAHVYASPDAVKKSEPNYILVRDGLAEKKPKKQKVKAAPVKKKE